MNRNFISNSNFVLRKVLNSKENIDILQDFIQTFLNIEIQEIKLNPYLKEKEKYLPSEEKFGIADVRIKLKNDKELNIGVQWIDGYYVQNKILLYYAQIHTNQLEYNKSRNFVKTITINILDFEYFKSTNYHQKKYLESNIDEKQKKEKMEFHILELPKFNERIIENIKKEEAWMIYLKGDRTDLIDQVIKKYDKISKLDRLIKEYWKDEKMD